MSYTIHKTSGIIIGILNRGEANRVYTIMTRDLGVIRATAQSSRKETSKMRYGLQVMSYSYIDCVYGREFWRLTGVVPDISGMPFVSNSALWSMWSRSMRLLERLIPYDEVHTELFDVVHDVYMFCQNNSVSENDVYALEKILVVRILHHLGYWHDDKHETYITESLSVELLDKDHMAVRDLVRSINRSLQASQL